MTCKACDAMRATLAAFEMKARDSVSRAERSAYEADIAALRARAEKAEGEVAEMLRSYIMLGPGAVHEIARRVSGASEREAVDYIVSMHRGGYIGLVSGGPDIAEPWPGADQRTRIWITLDASRDRALLTCGDVLNRHVLTLDDK